MLYFCNQFIKTRVSIDLMRWFLSCYFNDIIGGITFIAYCNIIFDYYNKKMANLWQTEFLLFCSGLFWEYITPLFRPNTVTDILDIIAYMIGGLLYWLIIRKDLYENK